MVYEPVLCTSIHPTINHPTHGTSRDNNIIFDIPAFCNLMPPSCQMTQAMLEKGISNPEVEGGNQINEVGTIVTRFKCTPIQVETAHDPTLVLLVIARLSIEVPQHNQFVIGKDLLQVSKQQVVEGRPFNLFLNIPILVVSGRISREHCEVLPSFGLKMCRDQIGAMLIKEE